MTKSERKRPRCEHCGYKIRGANHKEGNHHKRGIKGRMGR